MSNLRVKRWHAKFCKVCFDARKSEKIFTSHFVRKSRHPNSKVVCQTLLKTECHICKEMGHTPRYCPLVGSPPTPTVEVVHIRQKYSAITYVTPTTGDDDDGGKSIIKSKKKNRKNASAVNKSKKLQLPPIQIVARKKNTAATKKAPTKPTKPTKPVKRSYAEVVASASSLPSSCIKKANILTAIPDKHYHRSAFQCPPPTKEEEEESELSWCEDDSDIKWGDLVTYD